jgi:O-antigen/teichoic acid export membrane protein
MEVVFALPLLFLPFVMPMISGLMAKTRGRKFWPWFFIGIPLPLIANVILLYMPDKTKRITWKSRK